MDTTFLLVEHFSLQWDKMYCPFILTHFSQVVLYLCFTDGNRGLEGKILKCFLKIWWEIRLHMTCEPAGERNDFQGSHRKLVGRRENWNSPQIWDSASSVPLNLCCRQWSLPQPMALGLSLWVSWDFVYFFKANLQIINFKLSQVAKWSTWA